jgi:hypothetical protein
VRLAKQAISSYAQAVAFFNVRIGFFVGPEFIAMLQIGIGKVEMTLFHLVIGFIIANIQLKNYFHVYKMIG